ncbi:MAG: helix-hairpin-helix domain-containing protein [Verrucomicrobiales bacterium]|nr:helix-hairpin-helix domain-containing protein [Verrucomicrobiales bacterium]
MWKAYPAFRNHLCLLFLFLLGSPCLKAQKPLETFEGCTFVPQEWADGDSFMVKFPDGQNRVLRLYYVDCVEQSVSTDSDKRRLREQSRYFGVKDYRTAVEYGKIAATFTAETLSKSFTVHTSFADARGRSGKPRYYAFLTTAEGKDLSRVLVENGLARAFGLGRQTPSGTSRDEYDAFLADLELSSAIKRKGIWKHSDPDAIIEMRATEREDMRGLESIDDALVIRPPESPVDVNTASLEDLMRTGLRESLADAVIQNRPFENIDQLININGIGPVTLEKVKPFLRIETEHN